MSNANEPTRTVQPATSPPGTATVTYQPPAGYTDLTPHARGGIGEVLRATDSVLHRTVAVKRLQERRADDPEARRRFLVEAEVTARLEHPGVVPVYALFSDSSGRPAYAMRFVQGPTLWDAIAGYHATPDPVAFGRLLRSFLQACQTVAYAHSRGVIHRDLKPQNILLGKFGETLVVDWGLAKVVGRSDARPAELAAEGTLVPEADSGGQTVMGSAVGTPAYMSPEQAAGRWNVIDQRSDVYGLGAVLYTLLTGSAPLAAGDWPEMQQRIQRGQFPRPRQVRASVPRPLEAVCLKAMALDPADRYPTVEELAADVEHWVADEPMTAYPEGPAARVRRWARRHRPVVRAGVVLLLVGVLGLAAGAVLLAEKNREIGRERAAAETAQQKAEAINRFLVDDLLKQADPANNPVGDKMLVRDLLDKAAKRLDGRTELADQPEVEAEVRAVLGRAYESLGASEQAARQYKRAWELSAVVRGADHPDTLAARNEYVYAVVDADLDPNAVALAREAHAAAAAALGDAHKQTARAQATVGAALMNAKDPAAAVPLLRDSSATLRAVVGADDRLTLDVDNSLAVALGTSGRAAEAETLLRSIVERRRRKGNDPDLALAVGNHGYTLLMLGRYADAESAARDAFEVGLRSVGPEAPGTLQARSLLGYSQEGQGRWADAEKEYLATLASRQKLYPPSSLDVQRSVCALARLNAKQERWAESSKYLAALLHSQKPDRGRKPELLAADLEAALAGRAPPTDAEPLLRECAEAVKTPLWPGDWLRAEVASRHGDALRRVGKLDDARKVLEEAAGEVARSIARPEWGVAAARKRVADLYDARMEPDNAAKWK